MELEKQQTVRDVQNKILYIMKFIDKICRQNNIVYHIMGGTALGAVRHGGFIPWDDDLDIFMTPAEYQKFKSVFEKEKGEQFVLQEWKTTPNFLEYAKVRLNGTTFIEECFLNNKEMHHGIYVDIMILHKCPNNKFIQKSLYFKCKYVTLYALSKRNWKPKTKTQSIALKIMKIMPNKLIVKNFYKHIYKYDKKQLKNYKWFYWITPAGFREGLFNQEFFDECSDIVFEDTLFLCSPNIEKYLEYRYGDYMKLPSFEKRKFAIHAKYFDVEKDYKNYFN